jgi:hypothetical protein
MNLPTVSVAILTREHVGIFVHKLLDILLASREHYQTLSIMPILVSAGPRISDTAWLHAASWGVLLISPQRLTPLEILARLDALPAVSDVINLRADCEQLIQRIWRPINRLVYPPRPNSLVYHIETDQILDRDTSKRMIEFWDACVVRAPTA